MTEHREWTEAYRPDTLLDIVGNRPIMKALSRMAKNKNFPHLLFVGPSGTGKTCAAKALINDCFGDRIDFREFNASNERGIDTVRFDIKEFAETKGILSSGFKVLILDEFNAFTPPAQEALRRVMEQNSRNCRFILISNSIDSINDPILSRCRAFYFKPLRENEICGVIKLISIKEKISIAYKTIRRIAKNADGDLRHAINFFQSTCEGIENIRDSDIREQVYQVPYRTIERILILSLDGEFDEAFGKLERITYFTSPKTIGTYLQDSVTGYVRSDMDELQRAAIAQSLPIVAVRPSFETFCAFLVTSYINYQELKRKLGGNKNE